MAELRDLYDNNSKLTDKKYFKGEAIPDGYYPMHKGTDLLCIKFYKMLKLCYNQCIGGVCNG